MTKSSADYVDAEMIDWALYPCLKTAFEFIGIYRPENQPICVVGGNAVRKPEKLLQPAVLCFSAQFNIFPTFGIADNRTQGNEKYFIQ